MLDRCPDCGVPYALVGRAHRCVPRQADTGGHDPIEQQRGRAEAARHPHKVEAAGSNPAPAPNQLRRIATTSEAAPERRKLAAIDAALRAENAGYVGQVNGIIIRKPKRDRAAYMRRYRARRSGKGAA